MNLQELRRLVIKGALYNLSTSEVNFFRAFCDPCPRSNLVNVYLILSKYFKESGMPYRAEKILKNKLKI